MLLARLWKFWTGYLARAIKFFILRLLKCVRDAQWPKNLKKVLNLQTALDYKPWIWGPKFPCLVDKLSAILISLNHKPKTALKNGVKNIQAAGYNGGRTVFLPNFNDFFRLYELYLGTLKLKYFRSLSVIYRKLSKHQTNFLRANCHYNYNQDTYVVK